MPNYCYSAFGGVPIGTIIPWTGDSIPSGWLECKGQEVSRVEYARLFEVIGTTFGAGDGSTTFNLPNLKGRVIVGLDSSDADFDTIGKSGGEKTHTLTVDELPAHSHSISSDGDHNHTITPAGEHGHGLHYKAGTGAENYWCVTEWANTAIDAESEAGFIDPAGTHDHGGTTGNAGSHNHGGATSSVGSGVAHNNLQPYITLKFIIKAK